MFSKVTPIFKYAEVEPNLRREWRANCSALCVKRITFPEELKVKGSREPGRERG